MQLSSPRVLLVSFLVCLAVGVVGGTLFAVLGDRVLAHGIGAGLFVVGTIAFCMALSGATEPPEGWALRKRAGAREEGRRSLAARIAAESPGLEKVSSLSLALWGLVVGGSLIALGLAAFWIAAP